MVGKFVAILDIGRVILEKQRRNILYCMIQMDVSTPTRHNIGILGNLSPRRKTQGKGCTQLRGFSLFTNAGKFSNFPWFVACKILSQVCYSSFWYHNAA